MEGVGKKLLLVRPRPYDGESLFSYVHRLGELNGLISLGWAPLVLSKLVSFGMQSHRPLLLLAELVGLDPEHLSSMTCRPRPTELQHIVRFMNVDIPKKLFRRTRSAICVECLRERKATPATWDLRMICACVRHCHWLVDICPDCNCILDWRRERLLRCCCGSDFSNWLERQVEAPTSVLIFTKALEDWLRNELPFVEGQSKGFQRILEEWFIADFVSLFQSAERYVRRIDEEPPDMPRSTESHRFDMTAVLIMSHVARV